MAALDRIAAVATCLEKWKDAERLHQNPVAILERLADVVENEYEVYLKSDPDPFDDRHPGDRNNSRFFVILRVLRVTRVFKISRFSAEKMEQHGCLLKQNQGELTPLLLCFVTVLIVFSTVMYYSETDERNFSNIPARFWYTIVTMTSLGYGDAVPQTVIGKIVGAICSFSGIFIIALMAPLLQKN